MNGADKITITRWIETLLEAQERVHQAEREADKEALRLQRVEYLRRLEDLNHAHEQQRQDFDRFVSKDTYYSLEKDVRTIEKVVPTLVTNQMHETLINTTNLNISNAAAEFQRRVGAMENWKAGVDGKLAGAIGVVTLLSVVIGIVAHFWK